MATVNNENKRSENNYKGCILPAQAILASLLFSGAPQLESVQCVFGFGSLAGQVEISQVGALGQTRIAVSKLV